MVYLQLPYFLLTSAFTVSFAIMFIESAAKFGIRIHTLLKKVGS